MPASNPNRKFQGGDVEGFEATDVGLGLQIKPLNVAKASFDTGVPVGYVMDSDGYGLTKAELKLGYSSYGRSKIGNS